MKKYLLLKLIVLLVLVSVSTRINAQLTAVSNTGLPNIGRGQIKFVDFTGDGILDALVVGQTAAYLTAGGTFGFYKGNGDGTFTDVTSSWFTTTPTAVSCGMIGIADYDKDGLLDFCYAGFGTPNICKLYKNTGSSFIDVTNTAFITPPTGCYFGDIMWGDIDNDGNLDLLINGRTGSTMVHPSTNTSGSRNASFQIYKGNGNGTFTLSGTLNSLTYGSFSMADFDKDGDLDLIGTGAYGALACLFVNDGAGNFESTVWFSTPTSRGGVSYNRGTNAVMSDFNNDGKTDILQAYINNSNVASINLLTNANVGGTPISSYTSWTAFTSSTPTTAYGQSTNMSMVSAIDYNVDGFVDFTQQGLASGTTPTTSLYTGAGTTTFTDASLSLTGLHYGGAVWADVNNDGKPDLLTFGYTDAAATTPATTLYKNDVIATNTAPQAPSAITATPQSFSNVSLTWTMPSNADDHTPNAGLTYNVFVRDAFGKYYVTALADTSSGKCKVAAPGITNLNSLVLRGLPSGSYRWGVQAVDGSNIGGAWTKGSFVIGSNNQASNINISNLAATSMTISWTNGDQANRAVFMKAGFDAMPMIPDSLFTADAAFGNTNTRFRRSGWFCVYSGSGSTVNVTGLTANTVYTVAVLEYSGTGPVIFNLCKAVNNPLVTSTYLAPTTQASGLTISGVTSSQTGLSWTNGNGTSRAVFVKAASSGAPVAVNGTTYTANAALGSGSQIGASGWYCVYNGTGTSVTVTGLSEKTDYTAMVCEYNGVNGVQNYSSTTATGNPVVIQTISSIATQASGIAVIPGSNQFDITWTSGSGPKRVVFITQGITGSPNVLDNQTYTANTVFGQGTSDGNNWYCIYNGTGSSVSITGLTLNTSYRLVVYEYNGSAGAEKYLTTNSEFLNQSTTSKLPQTITFTALPDKLVTDVPFDLTATGGESGNQVTFASSDPAVATISGNTVTIVAAGTVNITASQLGNTDYADAAPVVRSLTINKVPQTISFNALTAVSYGSPTFDLTATGGASANAVTFASSNPAVATISGNTVTIVGVGTTNITASQTGNSIYADATPVVQVLTVNKANQSITFDALTARTYGSAPFDLTSTGGASGNTVTYASSNTAVATISGTTVTILTAGTTNITASQLGNANYNDATPVVRALTVNKASQTITFGILPVMTTLDAPFTLVAISSSGLAVTFTSSNTQIASVSGNTVTIMGAGNANITAACAASTNYNAATSVVQGLMVNKVSQTITFDALPAKTITDASFKLTATASSGRTVKYTSSDSTVAKIVSGDSIYILKKGITYITATQPGDTVYLGAIPVQRALAIDWTTAVSSLKEIMVTIYPNPASDKMYVSFTNAPVNASICIYNTSGGLVLTAKAEDKINEVGLSKLAPGAYIVKLVTPDGVTIKQIVKD